MNPLIELRTYLVSFATRCRSARWLAALFHVGVVTDIVEDVAANERKQAGAAHQAECLDLEAEKALDAGDMVTARRLIDRAAHLNHDMSEALA